MPVGFILGGKTYTLEHNLRCMCYVDWPEKMLVNARSPESQIRSLTHTHNVISGQIDGDGVNRLAELRLCPGIVNVIYGCSTCSPDRPCPNFTA